MKAKGNIDEGFQGAYPDIKNYQKNNDTEFWIKRIFF